jgi:hypothetical protein
VLLWGDSAMTAVGKLFTEIYDFMIISMKMTVNAVIVNAPMTF